ncbi:MarR family winged helix-turn-helix transcriptional regulator [Chryseobacterium geocarposphaerae]|uniref:MarR family transcriptional regulator n=1 Tax=Chryseobacterium geocarposphaerae TaxID=1416776 RepID=A0A2M9BXQ1_9FLAO|nr:MarR family transcriptional regulator [Chryseobacterium geocarposphaerae]PJJ62861.1 MarR family transcriptional regulator [Chryseobacterium geocarposphaerae]
MIPSQNQNISQLALELGLAMNEMKSRLRQKIQTRINEYDSSLSFELIEILGILWRNEGINQQEISTQISKDKSSITYLINNLTKRGLVERVENKNDRRNRQVFLTQSGKKLMEKLYPWALELYQKAAEGIYENELKNALLLIKQMTANLNQ